MEKRSARLRSKPTGRPEETGPDAGLWTIPNLISGLRIAAVPVFLWVLLGREDYSLAAWLLAAAALTDYLDGVLARRLGQVSEIGKFLDPLADRLVVFASVAGGLLAGVVPGWLGWPLLAREAAVGAAALYFLFRFNLKVKVRWIGKLATGLVFAAVPFYYLAAAGTNPRLWQGLGAWSGGAGLLLYLAVTWQYIGDMRRSPTLRDQRRE